MPLEPGSHLGVYRVTGQVGAGGMGEVYKARDTKLDRDVALKILPDAFVSDPERLARFQREAKVLASLNHPNIAAIYGLEDEGHSPALVLEYVEGPTLQDRIAEGPIPLDEALPIARQIAEALEAAHEQGIIHRDLKPANVKVKADGTVKVLDFGLAKALEPDLSDLDAANSPTMTATATRAGIIMGTAAYMSPEQAAGRPADRRSDNWSFGVVLWEMLTGRQLFTGDSISHVLAEVLKTDPEWQDLPAKTPVSVRRLLRRCLERSPKKRLPDAAMARLEIDEHDADVLAGANVGALNQTAAWRRPLGIAAITLLATVVGGLAVWSVVGSSPAPPRITRTSIVLPRAQQRTNTERRGVAISPAGTHVVYVANDQLYLRSLEEQESQPLSGTEDAGNPFFSTDGEWIGFFEPNGRTLKRVALSGAAAVTIATTGGPYGASWGEDDTIVFGQAGQGILRVAAAGGTPEVLISVEMPFLAHQPQMLPGGEIVLYTLSGGAAWDAAQIVAERVATGERTVLIDGASDGRYLSTGHLVYALGTTLIAVPFDVERLAVTNSPVPLVEGISRARVSGSANVDIAQDGTLVYLPAGAGGAEVRLPVWVDRAGNEELLGVPPRAYTYPRLSPDGTRVLLDARDGEDDLWIWDLTRETLARLTFAAEGDRAPVWSPDGERVVFSSQRDPATASNLYWRAADGTGQVERLTESANFHWPDSMTPDGSRLVFWETSTRGTDLMVLTLDDERRVEPLIATEFDELDGDLSPDGQWLAYQSNASGQAEIYVKPFPNVDDGIWQVSTAGASRPLWGPDGRELFYMTDAGVMAVTVETSAGFEPGAPTLVVAGSYFGPTGTLRNRTYDISRDGQRFLMLREDTVTSAGDAFAGLIRIHVVQNWTRELLERVPTGR